MNYSIQRLNENSTGLMKDLNKLFGEVFEDTVTYCVDMPSDEYLKLFMSDKNNIVVVAVVDGKVIGGLVAYTLAKFEMERREVYLYDLAVSKEHQRMGIGKDLMEELVSIARASGAYVVFVQADEDDDAVKFYESLGPSENIRVRSFDYLT